MTLMGNKYEKCVVYCTSKLLSQAKVWLIMKHKVNTHILKMFFLDSVIKKKNILLPGTEVHLQSLQSF